MIDFLTFLLQELTATDTRKQALKTAFAKQVGWQEKITNEDGKEIDNPVSFKDAFNRGVGEYVKGTCVAGQIKINHELAEVVDDFKEIIN